VAGAAVGSATGGGLLAHDAINLSTTNPEKASQNAFVSHLLPSDPIYDKEQARGVAMPSLNPEKQVAQDPVSYMKALAFGALEGYGGAKLATVPPKAAMQFQGSLRSRVDAMTAADKTKAAYKADKGIEDINNGARLRSAQANDMTRGSADLRQGLMAAEGDANAAIGSKGAIADALAANDRKMRGIGRDAEINKINDARQIEAERAGPNVFTPAHAQSTELPRPTVAHPGARGGPGGSGQEPVQGPGQHNPYPTTTSGNPGQGINPGGVQAPPPGQPPAGGGGDRQMPQSSGGTPPPATPRLRARQLAPDARDQLRDMVQAQSASGERIHTIDSAIDALLKAGVDPRKLPLGTGEGVLRQRLENARELNDLIRGPVQGPVSWAGDQMRRHMDAAKDLKVNAANRSKLLPALIAAGVSPAMLSNRDNAFTED
jgi:hypothetical protein